MATKSNTARPRFNPGLLVALLLALTAIGIVGASASAPQAPATQVSTAFTYQGKLADGGSPANGSYDFLFSPFDAASGGVQVADSQIREDVAVVDGYFTVTLDFGTGLFEGDARWLEVDVRPGASTGSHTTLSPRTLLTGVPYALGLRPGAVINTRQTNVPAITVGAPNANANALVATGSANGYAVIFGEDQSTTGGYGMLGKSSTGTGVRGESTNWAGVWGESTNASGVVGLSAGQFSGGVYGENTGAGYGVYGVSDSSIGVFGVSTTNIGVWGQTAASSQTPGEAVGVRGVSTGDYGEGVFGFGDTGVHGDGLLGVKGVGFVGVRGEGLYGVDGVSLSTASGVTGVYGEISSVNAGSSSVGVLGMNNGTGASGIGVWGEQDGTGFGVLGRTINGGYAVVGDNGGSSGSGYAGWFNGRVAVLGTLSKGGGSFKIDHPLDPANKYLSHSFVESPDMLNIYNGNVTTGADGFATVTLPDWFEALNRDFRYQLTVIGQFAQAIVAEEIQGNQFRIQTDKPEVKVSWQVTGIRHDPFAEAYRIPVEEDKAGAEKGHYLYPEVYGKSVRDSVWYVSSPNARYNIDHPKGPERLRPEVLPPAAVDLE
jgi:hypothetical protein